MSTNPDSPILTEQQTIAIKVVLSVILGCQVCILIGALYNTCFYLIPQRVTNTLIVLFYIVAFLVTASYATSSIFLIIAPENLFYSYDKAPSFDPSIISGIIADCGMVALALLILAKTIRIILQIHVLYEGIEMRTAICC